MKSIACMFALLFSLVAANASYAADAKSALEDGHKTLDKAIAFLLTQQQPNGSFQRNERMPAGITGLAIRLLAEDPKFGGTSEPVKKAVASLLAQQGPDGGIKGMIANYNTAIAVSALAATKDPALKEKIAAAVDFLKNAQFTDKIAGPKGEKIDPQHPFFGGWGYGGAKSRPDVSNSGIVIEALKDAGLTPDDPAYKNAVAFFTRAQNNSETNKAPWVGDDGGFIYGVGADGNGDSAAGEYQTPSGERRLRSYGSMTYAGLKSMIYAGLGKDDSRVKAAWKWIGDNWSVDEHPGMAANGGAGGAKAGIFYYYNTLGRALSVYGENEITDKSGKKHDWRIELIEKLSAIQQKDGSFVGEKQWMENDSMIATVLASMALQDALQSLEQPAAK